MSRNDDYTTGNSFDYLYHQKYCKLIVIDLSAQTNTIIPLQTNFIGKLEDNGSTMFFIAEKQQKTILKLFFRFINCNKII